MDPSGAPCGESCLESRSAQEIRCHGSESGIFRDENPVRVRYKREFELRLEFLSFLVLKWTKLIKIAKLP
jgi:hypothetical protein